ncbi:hypothetical protein FACS1894195_1370 [Bacteroidia bacterium]|nr:hypothetical protein FACS1894195_1370 [Bacteroidia bacterium]
MDLRDLIQWLYEKVQYLLKHGAGGGIPEAPTNGKLYGRKNSNWQEVEEGANTDLSNLSATGESHFLKTLPTVEKTDLATDVQNSLEKADDAIPSSEKGVADGVATLGGDGKVPTAQLPAIDLTVKADKVASATNGNFAGLDANGNLTDSGKKSDDFLNLVSAITQVINSDIAIALGKKIFGTDDNGTEHILAAIVRYGVGQLQTELGDPNDPMCLNSAMVAGWSTDAHVKHTYKDLDGVSHDERLAWVSELSAIINDAVSATGSTYSSSLIEQKIAAASLSGLTALYDFAKNATLTANPATADTGATLMDFYALQMYVYDGTTWQVSGTPIVPAQGNKFEVLQWLDGTSATGVSMIGKDGYAVFDNGTLKYFADADSTYTFDNDTIKPRSSDGALEVNAQNFAIIEDTTKFTTSTALTFKTFWNNVLNKINGLISFTTRAAGFATSAQGAKADTALQTYNYPIMTVGATDYFTEVKAKFLTLGGTAMSVMDILVSNQANFTPTGNTYAMNFYLDSAGTTFYIVATRVDTGDRYQTTYSSTTEKPVWKVLSPALVSSVVSNQYVKLGTITDLTAASARAGFRVTGNLGISGSNSQSISDGIVSVNTYHTDGAITGHNMSISAPTTNTTRSANVNIWSALSLIVTTTGDILLQNLGNTTLAFLVEPIFATNVSGTNTPTLVTSLLDPIYGQCWGGGSGNLDSVERMTGRLFNGQPTYIKTYTGTHGIDDDNVVAVKDTGSNLWVEYTKTPLLNVVDLAIVNGDTITLELSSAQATGTPLPSDFTLGGTLASKTITTVDVSLGEIHLTLDSPCNYNDYGTIAYTKGANLITTPDGATLQNIAARECWNATAPLTAPLTLTTAQGTAYLMAEDVYGGNDVYMYYKNFGSAQWTEAITSSKAMTINGISDGRVLAGNGNVTGRTQCSIEGNTTPQIETGDRWMISRKETQNLGTEQGVQYNWFNYPSNSQATGSMYKGIRGLGNIWSGTASNTGSGHYYFNNTALTSGNGGSCGRVNCFAVTHQP